MLVKVVATIILVNLVTVMCVPYFRDLSDNNLTGSVPDFLSQLSNLRVL